MSALRVAFVWHMHQPWYVWPGTQEAALPFARLHACGSYYDMPWLLRRYGHVKAHFNLVPSLTEQIGRYARGETTDRALELSRRPAADLDFAAKCDLLTHFASGHPESVLESSSRYKQLVLARGLTRDTAGIERAARALRVDEWRDLQVWQNLAWCGYALRRESEVVRELRAKDCHFTEDDKQALLEAMQSAVGRVLDLYREAASDGQAELTTSPFYHPILPLVCDMRDAERCVPRDHLPETLWQVPQEARQQLWRAREHHRARFGAPPRGLWPSEGAVSDASLALTAEAGFAWTASDEDVLAQSLNPGSSGRATPGERCRPYGVGEENLAIVFRDHELSDRIGFVYRDWRPADAAADIVGQLRGLASALPQSSTPGLVCVILDGENPWGWYDDDGEGFLRATYAALESDPEVQTTTLSEYLEEFPPETRLPSVFPGSWIDHSYRTWIGGAEHNRAWGLVRGALEAVSQAGPSASAAAHEHLMIAEGSDWFWWYSEQHHTEDEGVFDALFRSNVGEVYRALGLPEPGLVGEPIATPKMGRFAQEAAGPMRPTIDGRVTSYFEWQPAALLRTSTLASAMHRHESLVREVFFGFDLEHLWLRVDTAGRARDALRGCSLVFLFGGETKPRLSLTWSAEGEGPVLAGDLAPAAEAAVDRVVEAGLTLEALGEKPDGEIRVAIVLESDGRFLERWPERGLLTVKVPTSDVLAETWLV